MRIALLGLLLLAACENPYGHEVHYVTPTPVPAVTATANCDGGGCR